MATTAQDPTVRREPHRIGDHIVTGAFVVDLRDQPPDMFVDHTTTDWRSLTWRGVGRPYKVEKWATEKKVYEKTHGEPLPVLEGWKKFNQNFHHYFNTDVPEAQGRARAELMQAIAKADVHGAREAVEEMFHLLVWNRIHRVEDAVWDPRGKRALFSGLDVKNPRILFLGVDTATGNKRVWYRDQMDMDFEVEDIRNLKYGREFDIVVSIGLIEHFPDEHKGLAFEFHRRFVKPGGYVIMTTPRDQLRSRAWYHVMADELNYGYRELMNVRQMGLYATENGFDVLRAGVIKAHNGLICKVRDTAAA